MWYKTTAARKWDGAVLNREKCPGTGKKAEAAEGVPQNRQDCKKLAQKARKHSNLAQLWHSTRWKPAALFKSLLNFTKLFSTVYSSSRHLTQQWDPYWVAAIPHIKSFLFVEEQKTNAKLSLFTRWRMFWTRYKLSKVFSNGTTWAKSGWTPFSSTDLSCSRLHALHVYCWGKQNQRLRASALRLLWPSCTERRALRIHPRSWCDPGQTCPRTWSENLQLAGRRAMKSFWENNQSASQLQLFFSVLTSMWKLVLQGMKAYANNGIWRYQRTVLFLASAPGE